MSDITLQLVCPTIGGPYFDLVNANGDIATGKDLETSIAWLLFADARAEAGDDLPIGETDRRGWCLDYLHPQGYQIGSRAWVLLRGKSLQQLADDLQADWLFRLGVLVADGAARTVEVLVTLSPPLGGDSGVLSQLNADVTVTEPTGQRWQHIWQLSAEQA